jgi:hypothetical protein
MEAIREKVRPMPVPKAKQVSSHSLTIFKEKSLIVDFVSGCENAGQEHASRRQRKSDNQGERRHDLEGVSLRADATTGAAALSARPQAGR